MNSVLAVPATGIIITLFCYVIGGWIYSRVRSPLCNPFFISAILIIIIITNTPFTLEEYQIGGSFIVFFMVPATAVLALRIYRQRALLRANILPILLGCSAGAVTSLVSVRLLCRLFAIDDTLLFSLLPKSVTTAIAMQLAEQTGGIEAVAVVGVTMSGIVSTVIVPIFLKLFALKDPVALGIGLGTAGHVIGTAKALEFGEAEGAMSGLALCLTGIITSILYLFLF